MSSAAFGKLILMAIVMGFAARFASADDTAKPEQPIFVKDDQQPAGIYNLSEAVVVQHRSGDRVVATNASGDRFYERKGDALGKAALVALRGRQGWLVEEKEDGSFVALNLRLILSVKPDPRGGAHILQPVSRDAKQITMTGLEEGTLERASAHRTAEAADEADESHQCELAESATSDTTVVSGRLFRRKEVTYAVVDGQAIFEGDIVLSSDAEADDAAEAEADPVTGVQPLGIIVTGDEFRWPKARVAYRVDPNLPDAQRVTNAIKHWEANTKIRFIARTNEPDFVTFRAGDRCSSRVGKVGGEQFVTLSNQCSTGSVIHEIGHAVGLWHEQSREDRDTHVTIILDNVKEIARHNFSQHINDGDDVHSYDYDSIMHYPKNAFAIDTAKPTIVPQPPEREIGQRRGLSVGDIRAANLMYP